jgi:hypothetical protein
MTGTHFGAFGDWVLYSECPARRQVAACGVVGLGRANAIYVVSWFQLIELFIARNACMCCDDGHIQV